VPLLAFGKSQQGYYRCTCIGGSGVTVLLCDRTDPRDKIKAPTMMTSPSTRTQGEQCFPASMITPAGIPPKNEIAFPNIEER
jgi:hypothetical protein